MPQRDDLYSTAPQDAHERERRANVRPAGWRNPQPADRYSLVVDSRTTAATGNARQDS